MSAKYHIFCFHRVSDEYSPAYPPIPVKVFDRICRFIKRNYNIIDIEDSENAKTNKNPSAIITFDDAYMDFYENALPILFKYKIPAIQHIITHSAETGETFWTQKLNKIVEKYFLLKRDINIPEIAYYKKTDSHKDIEQTALEIYLKLLNSSERSRVVENLYKNLEEEVEFTKMMQWKEINECISHGIRFGSHTHTHINLSQITENEIREELQKSKDIIIKNTSNSECISLAFPNGQYNENVLKVAHEVGFKYLFSTEAISCSKIETNSVLPRISIYSTSYWKNYLKLNLYKWTK